jgi:hypothetical protein
MNATMISVALASVKQVKADVIGTILASNFKQWRNLGGDIGVGTVNSAQQANTPADNTKKPCWKWTKSGKCPRKGCKFLHDPEAKGTDIDIHETIIAAMQQFQDGQQRQKQACRNFRKGKCQRRICKYSHDMETDAKRKVNAPCWSYQRGECRRINCRFTHDDGPRGRPTDAPRGQDNKCAFYNKAEGCRFGTNCNKAHHCAICSGKDHNAITHEQWLKPKTDSM